jgi:hypothetical protein
MKWKIVKRVKTYIWFSVVSSLTVIKTEIYRFIQWWWRLFTICRIPRSSDCKPSYEEKHYIFLLNQDLRINLLYTKIVCNILFLTLVIVEKHFLVLVIVTLDPLESECHPDQSFHMRLINTKFDYNISILTYVIFQTHFCVASTE